MKKPRAFNSLTVTLILLVAGLVYAGYWIVPVWWPVFQLTGIMRGICNDAYHQRDNEILIEKLLKEGARTGLILSKENFQLERVAYSEEEIQKFDEQARPLMISRGKECVLRLIYVSNAKWPFLDKSTKITWRRSISTDLGIVKY